MKIFFLTIMLGFSFLNAAPQAEIPTSMINDFTMGGKIPVVYRFADDSYSEPRFYSKKTVNENIAKAKARLPYYYYMTDVYLYQALDKWSIDKKKVAVMGSVTPWYESIVLAFNGSPTTIEYNKIKTNDPRLRILTVDQFEKKPETFDAILSISSYEHDGLGRYGDPINPRGDLIAMEKTKKMLKKGGILFLSVPIGKDCLVWNLHRIYGKIRLKALIEGWELVDSFGFSENDFGVDQVDALHQPILVLRVKK